MIESFVSAIALVFVIEGLLPFALPSVWRKGMVELIKMSDGKLRVMGLLSIAIGIILLMMFK
ncbi:MAG: DUF2065 domain-containing protein [Piscirickettsiaceae bacterium CG_4_9_14_3_um_filter_43_564]|nr:DUF2065 domain-containing protein [Thiomicrospira sp.]OIP96060.1 MAG: hypothetical protein AUK56_03225 [Thiomicrospira sp. CG2_30_44_34]PIQ03111.1 MAG: hypothetical protein COW74_08330 [Piscirickettsiaceae bacterium CG18_big_fil_WC_8_21_14_2_50_44_103]PIU39618.1 MAG: DUF2065 domain-containing protein [Piscirickettsiaceae bacterium CG07_land_8_20_14_0_80_44_28]PIW57156.1 MAG: DUF2065 domain-containing protein [Piscirickettsiaceae bacterium CG12_big_fil_rev_8_21_14_0_65_44_934]PIW77312.1 MAG: